VCFKAMKLQPIKCYSNYYTKKENMLIGIS